MTLVVSTKVDDTNKAIINATGVGGDGELYLVPTRVYHWLMYIMK